MSFNALSNEILLEIFEHIAIDKHLSSEKLTVPPGGQTSLRCLSLCSWRLNGLVTPILYRTFIDEDNLYLFLRTVLTKPDYARHVRQFVGRKQGEKTRGDYSEQDFALCRAVITTISSSKLQAESWMADLQQENWHAMVALLLFVVPNLEVLRFDMHKDDAWYRNQYISWVLEYAASVQVEEDAPASPLTKLWFISFGSQYHDHVSIKHLRPLLTLKSVSKAYVRGLWDSSIFVPTQSALQFGTKDLQINHYDICSKSVIIGFLRCFGSLERFTSTSTVLKGVRLIDSYDQPLPQHLGQAIAHLTHCLEELALYNVKTTTGGFLGSERPQSIGSLAQFEKLRIIRMDASVLFGPPPSIDHPLEHEIPRLTDILPRSVRELTIGNCAFDQIKDQLQRLLARRGEFPALEKIHVRVAAFAVNEEIRQNLIKDYETAGVSLAILVSHVGASLAGPEDPGWIIHD
jgi:hypothetical protein